MKYSICLCSTFTVLLHGLNVCSMGNDGKHDTTISNFVSWLKIRGYNLHKVKLSRTEAGSTLYQVTATDYIEENEDVFEISTKLSSSILSEETCSISSVLQHVGAFDTDVEVKLVLCLMYEYTFPLSLWRPYLELVPKFEDFMSPLLWNKSDIKSYLSGSGCEPHIKVWSSKLKSTYSKVVAPFIQEHTHAGFDDAVHDYKLFMRMYAFQSAQSFQLTDSGRKMIVPYAGFFNCGSRKRANAELYHDDERSAFIKSTRTIAPGEEVVIRLPNTANCHLLTHKGYVEDFPHNFVDAIDVPMTTFFRAASRRQLRCLSEKFEWLASIANYSPCDGVFEFGLQGVTAIKCSLGEVRDVKHKFVVFVRALADSDSCDKWAERMCVDDFYPVVDDDGKTVPNLGRDRICSTAWLAVSLSDAEKRLVRDAVEEHISGYPEIVSVASDDDVTARRKDISRKLISAREQLLRAFVDRMKISD